ncbi:ComF family protein [Arthrobacter sp. H20]|uniref:ComF family protein n=1 Tax=Arthrobacter sp. H20 TaxID=1267981 RepID=UPI000688C676|nr:ComF family protein [Arthrobacter sp. H20]
MIFPRMDSLWAGCLSYLDSVRLRPGIVLVAAAIADFWSLIFPTECAVCGRASVSLCLECQAKIREATVHPFRADGAAPALPQADRPALSTADSNCLESLPVTAAGHYRATLARLILAYKSHHRTDIVRPLQAALASALHAAVNELRRGGEPAQILLVPAPPKGRSMRRRGYDPVAVLLNGLERRGELPAGCQQARLVRYPGAVGQIGPLLEGRNRPQHQKGLGRSQRRANVRFTMTERRTRDSVQSAVCLVVDDVLTTGATIAEVTRVLRLGGARVVGGVVVAATAPPSGAE